MVCHDECNLPLSIPELAVVPGIAIFSITKAHEYHKPLNNLVAVSTICLVKWIKFYRYWINFKSALKFYSFNGDALSPFMYYNNREILNIG